MCHEAGRGAPPSAESEAAAAGAAVTSAAAAVAAPAVAAAVVWASAAVPRRSSHNEARDRWRTRRFCETPRRFPLSLMKLWKEHGFLFVVRLPPSAADEAGEGEAVVVDVAEEEDAAEEEEA